MIICLDKCALQRPLDDKAQLRVSLEAAAILVVLAMCESGKANLVSFDALEYETVQNPQPL